MAPIYRSHPKSCIKMKIIPQVQAHMSNQTNLVQEVSVYLIPLDTKLILFPVAAEYLAKGYSLSDHILQRAIEIDSEYRIFNHPFKLF
jgi:formate dehydrogenase assembly factor FdhD